jgi:hypothetical protein
LALEIEMCPRVRVRVCQWDEKRYVLTATLLIDESFELGPQWRHLNLHAQRLDNQLLWWLEL